MARVYGASYAFKVIIVGDSNVGKTTVVHRFLHDEFKSDVHLTVGVDFGIRVVQVGDIRIKLQIWDTAGQEMYKSIAAAYYRNSAGCVAMFDLTSQKSFQSLQQWTRDIRHTTPGAKCIIVGNKTDLTNQRVVSTVVGNNFAESINAVYAETSALDKNSVHNMFTMITSHIYNYQVKTMDARQPLDGITILDLQSPAPNQKTKPCNCKQ